VVDYEQLILSFTSIIYEALPFVVLGALIAGVLEEFVPQQAISRVIPRSRPLAIALGGMLGLVFPMCECGIIVVMKRLLRKGLPLSVCVAYMLAGPIINGVVMLSTYVAFDPPQEELYIFGGPRNVVLLRVGMAYVISITTALLVEWQAGRVGQQNLLAPSVLRGLRDAEPGPADDPTGTPPRTAMERLNNVSQTALHDFVDIMAFLILGAALAAGGRYALLQTDLVGVIQNNVAVAILMMMGIAVLFCLCSEADAFVAANFPAYWPAASKLSFLVLGPMLDLKLYLMYTRVFRTRLILTIFLAVATQVFLYSLLVHYLWGPGPQPDAPPPAPVPASSGA
jgi:hypothetical protein